MQKYSLHKLLSTYLEILHICDRDLCLIYHILGKILLTCNSQNVKKQLQFKIWLYIILIQKVEM